MQTIANSSGIFNRHLPLRTGARRLISAEVIASIRVATRLEDIIAERIPLRRSGRVFVGSCPWHKSRSGRSFVVYLAQQTGRCWGCAVGGDVFGFLMRWGDVRFPSAVRLAAKIAGVKIDGNDLSEDIDERVSARTELAQLEQQTSAWHGKLQEPKTVNAIRTFAVSTRLLNHLHGILQTWRPNAQQLVFATRNGTPWDANLLVTVWRFR